MLTLHSPSLLAAVSNRSTLVRHRVFERVVSTDLPLCLPDTVDQQNLGPLLLPLTRVGALQVTLILEEMISNRITVRLSSSHQIVGDERSKDRSSTHKYVCIVQRLPQTP